MTRVSAALTTLTRSRAHEAGGEASGTADADSTFAALLEGATTLDGATSGQGKHPVGSGEGNESDGDERDDGGGGGTSGVRHHRTSHETGHSAASSGAMLEASAGAIGAASLIVTAPAAALAASTGTRQLASARVASEVGGAAGRTVPASQLRSPAGEDVGGTAATTLQTPRGATPGDRTQAARTDDLDGGAVAAPGVPARGDARGVEAPTGAA
ncbi:MAG TPA: hypothetical protein VMD59_04410, partial [Acidimicrobiales bacterium]|nr:hypothetical protein [Acidimicrobiales bacterium]